MSEQKVHKFYMSSSAFAWGELVFTDSKAGCVRSILLANHGIREGDIPIIHKVRGELHEENWERSLQDAGKAYQRECSTRLSVPGYPDVVHTGRMDFIRTDDAGLRIVEELKSTESTGTATATITKGQPKTTHLAQVVSYMVAEKIDRAYLIYGFYKNNNDGSAPQSKRDYEHKKSRSLEITIDDAGRICVDMMPSGFTVGDLYNHKKLVAKHLTDDTVGQRPKDADAKFGSPCTYCIWKPACDAYDSGAIEQTTDSFVSYAKPLSEGEKK